MKRILLFFLLFFIFLSSSAIDLKEINLDKNFKIKIYADKVKGSRTLAYAKPGVVFVGTRIGKVYALIDDNNDFKADRIITIADDLNQPNGIDYYKGNLYVAEIKRILVFKNILENLKSPKFSVLYNNLPDQTHHEWRYLKIGPDEKIYVSIGAPCNVCNPKDERFATICRLDLSGNSFEIYARGIRNSVGFDWHPETNNLWFTDNGRDWMGDNLPPDELNRAENKNLHFGFPYIHGKNIQDPKFGKNPENISNFKKPEVELGPHVAALGMRFYTKKSFPEKYHKSIFIAQHGSWNRSTPIGYRVINIQQKNNEYKKIIFADGWLKGRTKLGRPVDIEILSDGSIIVSDDKNGIIYRIFYKE